jgi:DMSO/TMAO reductase YedYZ molybdopterin-dependent catalytic subunit
MTTATTITPLPGVAATEAVDPRLVVVKRDPFNAETPLAQQTGLITPIPLFYVRSNFAVPRLDAAHWRLSVEGEVARPHHLSYAELRALPTRSLLVTLECAGNDRSTLSPPTEGEPWQYGAVGTAEWTGVPLAAVLEAAGLADRTREILVEGADRGTVATRRGTIPFARSLPLDKALHPDTLLAYAMNGELLTAQHGFPVRLIVPGWYGMASVKWVTRVAAVAEPFDGFFQTERYILSRPDQEEASTPVSVMRVRSLILSPLADAALPVGRHRVRGLAWSGAALVQRVEVSADDGASWEPAEFASRAERYAWRRWEYTWEAMTLGLITLRSRAFDGRGHTQPSEPEWNRLGYANNAIQVVAVQVIE